MKQQLYRARKGKYPSIRRHQQFLADNAPPYLLTDPPSVGLDGFLSRFPIATINEYGERIISGKRIC